ncbi:hypothetical protein F6R98_18980 [Candidatus Methylospira mobilis]|uniref:Uncharacterized protein n=1 Tax=Candidatus Methylospira mobilis TaxID=1808979 RepID=A0A5Q0BQH6_9GAMM|nr:hypothetical protein [Candidatus Methylospira mobilis]QFY44454.1 hypothetical protein F6R98_18980 [Candidatus Methylospira mobilis]
MAIAHSCDLNPYFENKNPVAAGLLAAFLWALPFIAVAGVFHPQPETDQALAAPLVAEGEAEDMSFDEQAREMRIWMRQRDQERRGGGVGPLLDLSIPKNFVRPESDVVAPRPSDPFQDSAIDDSGYRAWGDTHIKLRNSGEYSGSTGHSSRYTRHWTTRHGRHAVKYGKGKTKKGDYKETGLPEHHQAPVADDKGQHVHDKKPHEQAGVNKDKTEEPVQTGHKKQKEKQAAPAKADDKKQRELPPREPVHSTHKKQADKQQASPDKTAHKKQTDKQGKSAGAKAHK